MIKIRPYIRKIHRVVGLLIGLPFAIICITGAMLVFEPQLLRLLHPDHYYVSHDMETSSMPLDELYHRVSLQIPSDMTLGALQTGKSGESWRFEISSLRNAELFVDPVDGRVLGIQNHDAGIFYHIRKFHRWMGDTLDRNSDALCWGRIFVGIISLFCVLEVITGFYLWFPRSWKSWRSRFRLWGGTTSYQNYYHRHSTLGALITVPVLVLALTGLTWSFTWYNSAFYQFFGVADEENSQTSECSCTPEKHVRLWDSAYQDFKNLQNKSSFHESAPIRWIRFEGHSVKVREERGGNQISVHEFQITDDGHLTAYKSPEQMDAQSILRGWIVTLHEGIWCGIFSQILTFLVVLIGVYLVFSGYKQNRLRHHRKRSL